MQNNKSKTDVFRFIENEELIGKGKIEYNQGNKKSNSGTFLISGNADIFIYIPRYLMSNNITLTVYDESLKEKKIRTSAEMVDLIKDLELYKACLDFKKLEVGLYFLEISINTTDKTYYCYKDHDFICFEAEKKAPDIQITVSDFKFKKPNVYGGIIYHIFVDRFARGSDFLNNGDYKEWGSEIPEYQNYPGEPIENKYHYGGTLWGVIEKLDYIRSLGVTHVYLSPIFESFSNHKYDTGDYMSVDKGFGGEEALKTLIYEAEKRGISIILDCVFNHTGIDSVYFNKNNTYNEIGAYQSKDSKYYSWYKFKHFPNDYECWWGIKILPRINTDNSSCREYFTGINGVITKYANIGIGGIRLDVADELSDSFIKDIKSTLSNIKADSVLYGEVWEDASSKIAYGKRKTYYLGDELDGVMNYPLRKGIIDYLVQKETNALDFAINEVMLNAPKRIRDAQMNLLGSHDTVRILTELSGKETEGLSNKDLSTVRMSDEEYKMSTKRLKAAYTVLATLPGIPTIYYGDEVGMEGYNDPFNRRTFPWDDINDDILSHYKKIGHIRRKNKIYKDGEFRLLYLTIDILLFVRYNKNRSAYYTVLNNSRGDLKVSFSSPAKSLIEDRYFGYLVINPEEAKIFKASKDATLYLSF